MVEQPFSHVHCSLNSRSWTNPLTNSTFLAEVELERYLRSLFMAGEEAPPDVQLAFFHEAMHHWCFLSPVGATLASLQLRARRLAWELYAGNDLSDDEQAVMLEDILRYTTATNWMRPLAEGLALFAQFDVGFWSSASSSVISQLNQWANFFFQSQLVDGSRLSDFPHVPPVRQIGTLLSEKALESKAGLLCNSLTCTNGGYLPGYLLVKNLWNLAASRCERLRASDPFLTYLRCFFYDDYGFVAVLLDPSTSQYNTVNAIIAYFNRRFQQFEQSNFTDVSRFEEEILKKHELITAGGDTIGSDLLCLSTDAYAAQLGQKRLQTLIVETTTENFSDVFRFTDANTMFIRDLMCVGSLNLSISIARESNTTRSQLFDEACKEIVLSKAGKVLLRLLVHPNAVRRELCMACQYDADTLEIMMPYAPALHAGQVHVYFPSEVEEWEGEGSLDLYFSQLAIYKACVISLNEKPIVYLFFDPSKETGKAAREQFMERYAEKVQLETFHAATLSHIFEQAMDKSHFWVKATLEHIQQQQPSLMDQFYLPVALYYVPDEKLQGCIHAMRKRGFYDILSKDGELVRALALLDTSTCLTSSREVIARWFSSYGLSLDTTIAALGRYGEEYNLPKILEMENRLGCRL